MSTKIEQAEQDQQLRRYTVVGMFPWDERVAEVVAAETAAQAERLFSDEANRIAGVLYGEHVVDPEEIHPEEIEYTVLGYYADNGQRYGASVEACSAREAEALAIAQCNGDNGYPSARWGLDYDPEIIVVCGVVEGSHHVADVYSGGEGSVFERASRDNEAYELKRRAEGTLPCQEA